MKTRSVVLAAAAAAIVVPAGWLAAQDTKPDSRGTAFAPWDPAKMAERRKAYGLEGPGPAAKPPQPRFPAYLRKPASVEELVPLMRAAVTQTGGRVPLGLANAGDTILVVVPWHADPVVQDALGRAFKERKVNAFVKYEHELAGVKKEDIAAASKAELLMQIGDGQQELNFFFELTGQVPDPEKGRDWVREKNPELYRATWPEAKYPDARLAKLAKEYEKLVDRGLVKFMDEHPQVSKVYMGLGARNKTRRRLGKWADKFFGNYTYLDHYDIASHVPTFPGDVWRLLETKAIEPLAFVDRVEVSDPEGTALAADISPQVAETWAKGVYQQGHLYMFPAQATGRWPYSLVKYPAYDDRKGWLAPVLLEVNGVIASTNSHRATHPRMEVHIQKGQVKRVLGGGWYGEGFRTLLGYPGTQDLTWPFYDRKGYWYLYEAGTGTNPKYFKHPGEILAPVSPRELLNGGNLSERNVSGVIHWAVGTEAQHGPEAPGAISPKTVEFGTRHNVPVGHSMHQHNVLPTYQVRIRDTGQWQTLIEHGQLASLSDPEVRALAARYGDPDKLLRKDFVHPVPGINAPGGYEDYARDPGAYWTRWARDIESGKSPYLKP
ncbi:MAG TPA: hypothetical protein VFK48_11635 [Usitatibacter sp.]|nr:hypothetical protein [Usitatibacter sp.]